MGFKTFPVPCGSYTVSSASARNQSALSPGSPSNVFFGFFAPNNPPAFFLGVVAFDFFAGFLVSEEIDYIQNFVKLQKERFNRPDQIFLEIEGDARKRKIAPLILITFIENCFKGVKLIAVGITKIIFVNEVV